MQKLFFINFLKNINFSILKKLFFLLSLFYFCFYFFKNFDQISFNIDFARNYKYIFSSFLFCILSIFFNALAWENIVIWFGKTKTKNKDNLISFYVLTNVLKYVPGGIWHFFERYNFLKEISNPQLAFYSTLIEPYFMLTAAFFLASIGIIFAPLYFLLLIPLVFLNRKLIYLILRKLEKLKSKTISTLKINKVKYRFEERIKIVSFFPMRSFLIEILFVLSKFIGFIICLYLVNLDDQYSIFYLLVIFCLSWAIGLIVPTAPGGVGVFEACFLFFVGKNIPQNIILVSLIYFRLISTSADLFLGLPFLLRKLLKRI
ncbi:hypothetical protein OA867_00395 [Prochlorococcus sp. AH-716-D22]|nr:hypothetical protein [Prochlorococcus sp. AH-716-D22]